MYTEVEDIVSVSVSHNHLNLLDQIYQLLVPTTLYLEVYSFPQQLRELFVTSLHGDLSDQKGGQSRHPEAHRAQRRGQQSVDSVSPSGRHNQQPSSQIYRVKSSVFVL